MDHLIELRARLFVVAAFFIGGNIIGYLFQDRIVAFLLAPLKGEKLVYLNPGGGLDFILKVSFYIGLVCAFPVLVYELYNFLSPIFKFKNRRLISFILSMSLLLAVCGILFGYTVILPSAMQWLSGVAGKYIQADLTGTSYIDFVAAHSLGMALLFQIPVLLIIINSVAGPIRPSRLLRSELYAGLAAVIVSILLAPPDPLNQALVGLPIFFVYQIGMVTVLIQNNKPRRAPTPEWSSITYGQEPEAVHQSNEPLPVKKAYVSTGHTAMDVISYPRPSPSARPAPAAPSAVRPQPKLIDGMFISSGKTSV